jgi:hypothetical protein
MKDPPLADTHTHTRNLAIPFNPMLLCVGESGGTAAAAAAVHAK